MEYIFVASLVSAACAGYTEPEGKEFMAKISKRSQELFSIDSYKEWAYDTTLTDAASKESQESKKNFDDYQIQIHPEVMKYPWQQFKDPLLKRQFWLESYLDDAALPKEKRKKLAEINDKMNKVYNSAKVKVFNSPDNKPTLQIEDVAKKFREDYLNAEEMAFYWQEWHNTVGRPEKDLFAQWIELQNEIAVLNHFKDNTERWHLKFETENFEGVMAQLFQEISPFFKELHAYIRHKLWIAHKQNSTLVDPKGPIPASLLGNMWGLDAINIYKIAAPYPNKPSIDASPQLKAKGYTGLKMAQAAEDFYVSMGMEKMTEAFWKNSIFERKGREMDCSPTSFTFSNGYDYRIHFCTSPTQDDFGVMHHEMGHIENFMLFKNQPFFFQDAANPGFSEAIGDMMAVFATSPKHLQTLGLIDANIKLDKEQVINALFQSALADVFFFPYAYSLDVWRWDVMKGIIKPDNYNCEYWKKRVELQGVEPPVDRDETDFDPGAKLHVVTGYQYISYFVSGIVKYQFIRSLCEASKYYDPKNPSDDKPLVFCDIYNSKPAGDKLKKFLSMGLSHPWPDALEVLTGERKLDTAALLEFYKPLHEWLKEENKKNKVTVGWNQGHSRCHSKKKS